MIKRKQYLDQDGKMTVKKKKEQSKQERRKRNIFLFGEKTEKKCDKTSNCESLFQVFI